MEGIVITMVVGLGKCMYLYLKFEMKFCFCLPHFHFLTGIFIFLSIFPSAR